MFFLFSRRFRIFQIILLFHWFCWFIQSSESNLCFHYKDTLTCILYLRIYLYMSNTHGNWRMGQKNKKKPRDLPDPPLPSTSFQPPLNHGSSNSSHYPPINHRPSSPQPPFPSASPSPSLRLLISTPPPCLVRFKHRVINVQVFY